MPNRLRRIFRGKKNGNKNPNMAQPDSIRPATHAGSWYSDDEEELSLQLDQWLDKVPDSAPCIGPLSGMVGSVAEFPTERARIIIAPHAGYSYSGRAAAWAYRALDLRGAKRVFLLGPSHHHYTPRCLLSPATAYETPLGPLQIDTTVLSKLKSKHGNLFDYMSSSVDAAEHSLEMHLPYIHKILTRTFSDYVEELPPLVPIMVGNTEEDVERQVGSVLAEYMVDPANAFVVSSDFAHWGARFRYTYYEPGDGSTDRSEGYSLRAGDKLPTNPTISQSIGNVDMKCISAVESGSHAAFLDVLQSTGNTVCGRHPIGVIMAALEILKKRDVVVGNTSGDGSADKLRGAFRFVRYERSSECKSLKDSSVSYASAFAVL